MSDWVVKLAATVILVLAAVFAYGKMGPGIPISSVVSQKQDFFTVEGVGKVTVVPDTAIVELGINVQNPTVKSAQTQANTVIKDITSALKDLGIDSQDLKTSNYSIYPQYDYTAGRNRITGYQVNVSLTVKVRDIDKVNQVIDAATAKGANTIGGILLTVDETKQKQLKQQAREEAVKEAKTKAESLARAAGLSLGKIVNVQESDSLDPRPMLYAKLAPEVGLGGAGDTSIQPGSTDITSSVTLFYETR